MIYLMRHGLDDEDYVGGWSDKGLIPEGIKQVEAAINFLKEKKLNVAKIITSDIIRSKESAIMIGEALGLEVEESKYLRELNKGDLNGLKKDKALNEYLEQVELDTVYPNGESQITFIKRISEDLDEIFKEDNVLIVTHRGVINEIYRLYNGDSMSMDKKRYGVTHGSIHALDKVDKKIYQIF